MSDRQQDRIQQALDDVEDVKPVGGWQRRIEHRRLMRSSHVEAEGIEFHADTGGLSDVPDVMKLGLLGTAASVTIKALQEMNPSE